MCGGSKTVNNTTTIVESDRLARMGESLTLSGILLAQRQSLANHIDPYSGDRLAATDPNVTASRENMLKG